MLSPGSPRAHGGLDGGAAGPEAAAGGQQPRHLGAGGRGQVRTRDT